MEGNNEKIADLTEQYQKLKAQAESLEERKYYLLDEIYSKMLPGNLNENEKKTFEEERKNIERLKKEIDEKREKLGLNKKKEEQKNLLGNELKGSFALTLRRKKAMTTILKIDPQITNADADSASFDVIQQNQIDQKAREIEALVSKKNTMDQEELVDEIASSLNDFHETFNYDISSGSKKTTDLLKKNDFNSIALRKTSTKFRVTTKIAPTNHSFEPDFDQEKVEEYEKSMNQLIESAADIAAITEDVMCYGSLVLAHLEDSGYIDEFSSTTNSVKNHLVTFLKNSEKTIRAVCSLKKTNEFETEIQAYRKQIDKVIKIMEEYDLSPEVDDFAVQAYKKGQVKPGYIEKLFYQNALELRSVVSQVIVYAGCVANHQPNPPEIQEDGKDKKKKKSNVDFSKPIILKSYNKEKMFILESQSICLSLIHVLKGYIDKVYTASAMMKKSEGEKIDSVNKNVKDTRPMYDEFKDSNLIKIEKKEKEEIKCASLNRAVEYITSMANNNNFRNLFISTFPSFSSAQQVLEKLIERFHVPQEHIDSYEGEKKKFLEESLVRSIHITLKYFIQNSFDECNKDVLDLTKKFLENEICPKVIEVTKNADTNQIRETYYGTLVALIDRREAERNKQLNNFLIPPIDFFIPQEFISPVMFITMCDEKEIARQLTMADYSIYKAVEPRDRKSVV